MYLILPTSVSLYPYFGSGLDTIEMLLMEGKGPLGGLLVAVRNSVCRFSVSGQ